MEKKIRIEQAAGHNRGVDADRESGKNAFGKARRALIEIREGGRDVRLLAEPLRVSSALARVDVWAGGLSLFWNGAGVGGGGEGVAGGGGG